jgi:hypothetical protein
VCLYSIILKHYAGISIENKRVDISLCTYSAFYQHRPPKNIVDRQRPGLTLRDVRLAILIEDCFTLHFLANGYALPWKPAVHGQNATPTTNSLIDWMTGVSKFHKKSRDTNPRHARPCRVCGDQHRATDCPERYTKSPPAGLLCLFCREEGHWSMNCPQSGRFGRSKSMLPWMDALPAGRCKRCGGNHWVSDCPKWLQNQRSTPPPPPVLRMYIGGEDV